jgi:F-type H+-transporting ATPase subunit alpha
MNNFKSLLDRVGEVGFVELVAHSVIYVKGLPNAKPREVVVFETGELGQTMSLTEKHVEILLLSKGNIRVGTRVARTGKELQIAVGKELLGKTINPLGGLSGAKELRPIDITPAGINVRKNIDKPFETGITMVDLIVPLGKGQKELVIGDRKTGKTILLVQSMLTQARKGTICVYAAIAKKRMDIKGIEDFVKEKGIDKNTVIVSTSSSDPPGLVFVTPYTAMTIAEYFRDMGHDVLVLLDDLSAHAKYYREITLLAKRFPGRSSYPGDIFYIHSRLLERAGNFMLSGKEVSITCLPVAELVLSDFTGYIQSNLMAMTDGHIFFDRSYYNQGRRPAINPFLSVTRVGRQAQTPLVRDLNRKITSFLVYLEKLREFMHFGAELSEQTKRTLALGDRITAFFNQAAYTSIPIGINIILITALWAGLWKDVAISTMKREMQSLISAYMTDQQFRSLLNKMIDDAGSFNDLVESIKANDELLKNKIKKLKPKR